jgi:hypothetical protein
MKSRHFKRDFLDPEKKAAPSLYERRETVPRVFPTGIKTRGETSRRGTVRAWRADDEASR